MNWRDKSKEIAIAVLADIGSDAEGRYGRDAVLGGLQEAALRGMRWECENFVLRRR